jgi:hypothetical protein
MAAIKSLLIKLSFGFRKGKLRRSPQIHSAPA